MTANTLPDAPRLLADTFGPNLKRTRLASGMSQGRLALAAGLLGGQPAIARYEAAIVVPSLAVAIRMSRALGCTLDDLTEGF